MSEPDNRRADSGSKATSAAVMTLAGAVLFSSVLHTRAEAMTGVVLAVATVVMVVGLLVWLHQILFR